MPSAVRGGIYRYSPQQYYPNAFHIPAHNHRIKNSGDVYKRQVQIITTHNIFLFPIVFLFERTFQIKMKAPYQRAILYSGYFGVQQLHSRRC